MGGGGGRSFAKSFERRKKSVMDMGSHNYSAGLAAANKTYQDNLASAKTDPVGTLFKAPIQAAAVTTEHAAKSSLDAAIASVVAPTLFLGDILGITDIKEEEKEPDPYVYAEPETTTPASAGGKEAPKGKTSRFAQLQLRKQQRAKTTEEGKKGLTIKRNTGLGVQA